MAEPVQFKYRAFISYSHADTTWAKWLQRALESFRIDKDLVGRETAAGAVPKTLRPIFRDRDDFTAGHTLSEQTLSALDASHVLIVICSPASAKSHYVTEEIRLFKSRHPERPVIPLIVNGKPGDPEHECFPQALRFKLDHDGRVTDEPNEVLAADARDEGDGKNLAIAKVVAGLLNVSSDDVFRRAERERRRRGRMRNGIVVVLALLVVVAGGSAAYAWQQLKTNEAFLTSTLKTATEIVADAVAQAEKYGVPREATLALLTKAEALFDNMALLGRSTPELRYSKTWMLIQFARSYATLGDTANQQARTQAAYRLAGELAAQMPNDPEKLNMLSVTLSEKGDALVARGDVMGALEAYQDSLALFQRLGNADPWNAGLQRELCYAYDKVGGALMAQGNLSQALKTFQSSFAIAERLAKAGPSNAGWQHDLSASYERIGDVLMAQGNLTGALKSYQDSLAIRTDLTKIDPSNARWQRGLSVSCISIGDVLMAQGNLTGALKSYQDSLAIGESLARTDPSNAVSQRDLSISYERVGVVLLAQGNLAEALKSYQHTLSIAQRLATANPSNAGRQFDVSVSYEHVGDVLLAQENLAGALKAYQDGLAIRTDLTKIDPSNAHWQRALSVSYRKVGDVLVAQGSLADALSSYKDGLAIAKRLAKASPSNAGWQHDLAMSHGKVAGALARQGQMTEALVEYRQARATIAQLKEHSPGNTTLANALSWYDTEIAKLEQAEAPKTGGAWAEEAPQ
jgi:tetratricopeptide (TPR) repeat protein